MEQKEKHTQNDPIESLEGREDTPKKLRIASSRLKEGMKCYELLSEAEKLEKEGVLQKSEHSSGTGRRVSYYVQGSLPDERYQVFEHDSVPNFHARKGEIPVGYSQTIYKEGRVMKWLKKAEDESTQQEVTYQYHENGQVKYREAHDYKYHGHILEEATHDNHGRKIEATRMDARKNLLLQKTIKTFPEESDQKWATKITSEYYGERDGKLYSRTEDEYQNPSSHIGRWEFFNEEGRKIKETVYHYENHNQLVKETTQHFDESGMVVKTEETPIGESLD